MINDFRRGPPIGQQQGVGVQTVNAIQRKANIDGVVGARMADAASERERLDGDRELIDEVFCQKRTVDLASAKHAAPLMLLGAKAINDDRKRLIGELQFSGDRIVCKPLKVACPHHPPTG